MVDFTFAHREEGFDNHIEKSIRGYSQLIEDVVALSRYFIERGTTVVDIGCSTGKMTKALIDYNLDHCDKGVEYIGLENADGFQNDLTKRGKEIKKYYNNVEFCNDDARYYEYENCSLITSIFTLQFMPKRDRKETLQSIYQGLNEGGAFIFAEKTICENALVQDMMTFNYYDYKRKTFTTDDIMDKERELRHMMKPNTWNEIQEMIGDAGFKVVQPFWRNHMFVGALAIK
jgi:tRNA (cmo5U34)-methyltransferase|tara:strand:- start:13191 stop:13883 length:693 start_codon:yes stop_codon:yes gene_type:complete